VTTGSSVTDISGNNTGKTSSKSAFSSSAKGKSGVINNMQSCNIQSAATAAKAATDLLGKVVAARAKLPATCAVSATAEAGASHAPPIVSTQQHAAQQQNALSESSKHYANWRSS